MNNSTKPAYEKGLLTLLVVVALIIRLIVMIYFETFLFPTEKGRVGSEMGWIASHIAAGEGFKLGSSYTAWMAPVYPYILAVIYRIFEYASLNSTIAILVLQSFISALVVVPLYMVVKRIFNWQVGLLSAVLWIIHPASIWVATFSIWSTNLTALGMILIVALFMRIRDFPEKMRLALVLGIVIGLTALSDPVILTAIPFMALWLMWQAVSHKIQMAKQISIVAAVAILTILPWTIRNYVVFNQFVPIKGQLGVNLWLGNYNANINQPTAGIKFWNKLKAEYSEKEFAFLASLNEVELDKIMFKHAVDFISTNPIIFIKYSLYRVYLFWRMTTAEHASRLDRALLILPLMTLVGIFLSRNYWKDTSLLLLIFASYPMIYYVTHADFARFRFPIEGLMLLFIAFLLHQSARLVMRFWDA